MILKKPRLGLRPFLSVGSRAGLFPQSDWHGLERHAAAAPRGQSA